MSETIKRFNKLKKLKLLTYFLSISLFITFLIIAHFTKNVLLHYLLLFNNCLIFIINIVLIEIGLGYKLRIIYYHEIFKHMIHSLNPNIIFEHTYESLKYQPFDIWFKGLDASSKVINRIIINEVTLNEVKLYFNTHRKHKIRIFHGYLLTLNHDPNYCNEILVLSTKRPLFSDFKLYKQIDNYKVYSINDEIDQKMIDIVTTFIQTNRDNNENFNMYYGNEMIVFKTVRSSIFDMPKSYQKLDQKYIDHLIKQLNDLLSVINQFVISM